MEREASLEVTVSNGKYILVPSTKMKDQLSDFYVFIQSISKPGEILFFNSSDKMSLEYIESQKR